MVSPYARRIQLGWELEKLRKAAGLTHEELARRVGDSRSKISRLENARVQPNPGDVVRILDALGVTGEEWERLRQVARDAASRDWWHTVKGIGDRQAVYANLESGTGRIREYHPSVLPGLFQSRAYRESRMPADRILSGGATVEGVLEGRERRQQMFHRPGGPRLDLLLDEVVLWRDSAAPDAMVETLQRILEAAESDPKVEVRVLPIRAQISDYRATLGTVFIYDYPEPGAPVIVAQETIAEDVILDSLHRPEEVATYTRRYDLLWGAALPEQESIPMIKDAVARR